MNIVDKFGTTLEDLGIDIKKRVLKEHKIFDKTLLKVLQSAGQNEFRKYFIAKAIPKKSGTKINIRRFVGLGSNPKNHKMGAMDGAAATTATAQSGFNINTIRQKSIECGFTYWAGMFKWHDFSLDTYIDDIKATYMPMLAKQAVDVLDNVAAIAMYNGASKVGIGALTYTAAMKLEGKAPSSALLAPGSGTGLLNFSVLRWIKDKMQRNVEEVEMLQVRNDRVSQAALATTANVKTKFRAPIAGYGGGSTYKVLVSERTMDGLLDNELFTQSFIQGGMGGSALTSGKAINLYGLTFEVLQNYMTVNTAADVAVGGPAEGQVAGELNVEGTGSLEVTFVLGDQMGVETQLAGRGVEMVVQAPGSAGTEDPYARVASTAWKATYGARVLYSKAVWAITHASQEYVTDADKAVELMTSLETEVIAAGPADITKGIALAAGTTVKKGDLVVFTGDTVKTDGSTFMHGHVYRAKAATLTLASFDLVGQVDPADRFWTVK